MVVAVDGLTVHTCPFWLTDAFAVNILAMGTASEEFTSLASEARHTLAYTMNAVTSSAAVLDTCSFLTVSAAETGITLTLAVNITTVI